MNDGERLKAIERAVRSNGAKLDEVLVVQAAQGEQIKTLFHVQDQHGGAIEKLKDEGRETGQLEARILRLTVAGLGTLIVLMGGAMLKLVFGS